MDLQTLHTTISDPSDGAETGFQTAYGRPSNGLQTRFKRLATHTPIPPVVCMHPFEGMHHRVQQSTDRTRQEIR
jgi:hypothetical protein